jgi:hypothetical protein
MQTKFSSAEQAVTDGQATRSEDNSLKPSTSMAMLPAQCHFRPAREHDIRFLSRGESWRDCNLPADLAYASLDLLRARQAPGVQFVVHRKDNWKPKVDDIVRGQVSPSFLPGTDFDAHLDGDRDVATSVGLGNDAWTLRLIGVRMRNNHEFCLNETIPRIGPVQVADRFRVRWEVELSIALGKWVHRLDAINAERPYSVTALLQASLISALLARTHNVQTRPPQAGEARPAAPLHPQPMALQLAVSRQSIARPFDVKGAEAMRRWDDMAMLLPHARRDPNWRRRPSITDQLRGWKRQPAARNNASNHNLKAVA